MVDFLLVHDVGHGAWSWGRVWGHLTAPEEIPPNLSAKHNIGKIVSIDLPGHGSRSEEDTSSLTYGDFAEVIVREVEDNRLRDVILVGHGMSAPILLQAAAKLEHPPKRIVLFAGVLPYDGRTPLEMLPFTTGLIFKLMTSINRVKGGKTKIPKFLIEHYYSNDLDSFESVQIIGRFTPVPVQLLNTNVDLGKSIGDLRVTYVPLWRDRLVPLDRQRWMAEMLIGVDIVEELDSCHEVMNETPHMAAKILARYAHDGS